MPLVVAVAKSESIKEGADTWYYRCSSTAKSVTAAVTREETENGNTLLRTLPKKVRHDIKRKLAIYKRRGVTAKTRHSDHLSLRRDIPVLIDHERRAVRGTSDTVAGEFVKRFLVLFLCTDGYVDRYYVPSDIDKGDGEKNLAALSLFVGQGSVLHCFMYFCMEKEAQSGIWHYHHARMMLRLLVASRLCSANCADDGGDSNGSGGVPSEHSSLLSNDKGGRGRPRRYECVNFHVHQDYAKRMMGLEAAPCENNGFLYPFEFFHEPPGEVVNVILDF